MMATERFPRRAVVEAAFVAGVFAGAVKPAEAKGKTVKAGEWARHQAFLSDIYISSRRTLVHTDCFRACWRRATTHYVPYATG